jgi:hypothetical protein
MLDGYRLFSEPSSVEKGHQEIAGVLWGSVLLCCASSCSGVDLQRTVPLH